VSFNEWFLLGTNWGRVCLLNSTPYVRTFYYFFPHVIYHKTKLYLKCLNFETLHLVPVRVFFHVTLSQKSHGLLRFVGNHRAQSPKQANAPTAIARRRVRRDAARCAALSVAAGCVALLRRAHALPPSRRLSSASAPPRPWPSVATKAPEAAGRRR
jgi:hypothetical protein